MAEPTLSMTADDDLPRTIRRERDAKATREREARERDGRERLSMAPVPATPSFDRAVTYSFPSSAGTITDIDVPFGKLMAFFIKAVFAAIPALVILIALLWLFGHGLQTYFPEILKLKILIYMPK